MSTHLNREMLKAANLAENLEDEEDEEEDEELGGHASGWGIACSGDGMIKDKPGNILNSFDVLHLLTNFCWTRGWYTVCIPHYGRNIYNSVVWLTRDSQ